MSKRINANYEIVNTIRINKRTEIVIGHNPKAPSPYVCWKCYDGNNYESGDYCLSYRGAMQALIKKIDLNIYDVPMEAEKAEPKKRTFNVQFSNPENEFDETQFDLEDTDFGTMATNLVQLFSDFCAENWGNDPCWITGIEEVPYDGEEE